MTPAPLVPLHREAHNAVGLLHDRCVLFVRSQMLDPRALDVIADEARRLLASPTRPIAVFAAVPGDAGVSDKSLLERQQHMIASLAQSADTFFVMAVLGTSLQSRVMRTAVRMLFLGKSTLRLTESVDDAVAWLSPRITIDERTLREAVVAMQTWV